MDELMNDGIDIGALLGDAVASQGGEADVNMVAPSSAEPQATDVQKMAEPEPQSQEPAQPAFDQNALAQQMNQQAETIKQIAEQMNRVTDRIPEPKPAEPSEEDMIREQMKKDLGLDKIEEMMKQQEELIQKQNERLRQQEEVEVKRARDAEFAKLEAQYGNIDKIAIQNKIAEIAKTNPELANALNSPMGVKMLIEQGVGAVVKQPDPITPSTNGQEVDMSNQLDSLKKGTLSDADFGDLLLNSIQ